MKEIPITSFDNLQIGQAENTAAGTGCTVVLLGKDGSVRRSIGVPDPELLGKWLS